MATTLDSDPQGFVRSLFEEQKPEARGAMPRQQQNGVLGAMPRQQQNGVLGAMPRQQNEVLGAMPRHTKIDIATGACTRQRAHTDMDGKNDNVFIGARTKQRTRVSTNTKMLKLEICEKLLALYSHGSRIDKKREYVLLLASCMIDWYSILRERTSRSWTRKVKNLFECFVSDKSGDVTRNQQLTWKLDICGRGSGALRLRSRDRVHLGVRQGGTPPPYRIHFYLQICSDLWVCTSCAHKPSG